VRKGQTLGIVGESGSGKSTVARCIVRLVEPSAGEIRLGGVDIARMPARQLRPLRRRVQIVFQDPYRSLNPRRTVGEAIIEGPLNYGVPRSSALERARRLMQLVRMDPAALGRYPHQFSGGQRQRLMIAMALGLKPDILIADEPTTALDVTVQAQIMKLLSDLQHETGMGLILITHDLGVVAEVCDAVRVMYAGRVMERAPINELYGRPAHPYTLGLMHSIPRADRKGQPLDPIPGQPPNLAQIPSGCEFHPRCGFAREVCSTEEPPLYDVAVNRQSACHFWEEVLSVADRPTQR